MRAAHRRLDQKAISFTRRSIYGAYIPQKLSPSVLKMNGQNNEYRYLNPVRANQIDDITKTIFTKIDNFLCIISKVWYTLFSIYVYPTKNWYIP